MKIITPRKEVCSKQIGAHGHSSIKVRNREFVPGSLKGSKEQHLLTCGRESRGTVIELVPNIITLSSLARLSSFYPHLGKKEHFPLKGYGVWSPRLSKNNCFSDNFQDVRTPFLHKCVNDPNGTLRYIFDFTLHLNSGI